VGNDPWGEEKRGGGISIPTRKEKFLACNKAAEGRSFLPKLTLRKKGVAENSPGLKCREAEPMKGGESGMRW